MKILLVLMLAFPTGKIEVVSSTQMEKVEHCVNAALRVNQDRANRLSAFCYFATPL
jgi:hypothetical protein